MMLFFVCPQTSFPGNLHLILVLRPSGLLSSAPSPSSSTDLGFRFSQDDFLLKMPVRWNMFPPPCVLAEVVAGTGQVSLPVCCLSVCVCRW